MKDLISELRPRFDGWKEKPGLWKVTGVFSENVIDTSKLAGDKREYFQRPKG